MGCSFSIVSYYRGSKKGIDLVWSECIRQLEKRCQGNKFYVECLPSIEHLGEDCCAYFCRGHFLVRMHRFVVGEFWFICTDELDCNNTPYIRIKEKYFSEKYGETFLSCYYGDMEQETICGDESGLFLKISETKCDFDGYEEVCTDYTLTEYFQGVVDAMRLQTREAKTELDRRLEILQKDYQKRNEELCSRKKLTVTCKAGAAPHALDEFAQFAEENDLVPEPGVSKAPLWSYAVSIRNRYKTENPDEAKRMSSLSFDYEYVAYEKCDDKIVCCFMGPSFSYECDDNTPVSIYRELSRKFPDLIFDLECRLNFWDTLHLHLENGVCSDVLNSLPIEKPVYYSVTDSRNGKTYRTVKVGNQEWIAGNSLEKTDMKSAALNAPEGFHLVMREDFLDLCSFVHSQGCWDEDIARALLSDGKDVYGLGFNWCVLLLDEDVEKNFAEGQIQTIRLGLEKSGFSVYPSLGRFGGNVASLSYLPNYVRNSPDFDYEKYEKILAKYRAISYPE